MAGPAQHNVMQEIEETRRIALGEMGLILPQVVAVGAQTQKVVWTRARLYPKQERAIFACTAKTSMVL